MNGPSRAGLGPLWVWGCLCLGGLVGASGEVRAQTELTYDLTSLTDKSPHVAEALRVLREVSATGQDAAGTRRTLAGLQALREASSDALEQGAMLWLEGSVAQHRGLLRESREAFGELRRRGGSLADLALVELRGLTENSEELLDATDALFEIGPWVPQYAAELKKGIVLFTKLGKLERLAGGIKRTLDRAMAPSLRRRLEERLVNLWTTIGRPGEARGLLMRTWWKSTKEKTRTQAWDTLKLLKAKPSFTAQVARVVLQARRSNVGPAKKNLRFFKARTARQRVTLRWATQVLNRFRSDLRPRALKQMVRLRKHIRSRDEPYFLFAHALVLRTSGFDKEAADVYGQIAHQHPGHHLAAEAALEAAQLLARLGDRAEGLGAFQRAIRMAPRGPFHREGLWEVGFGTFLAGGYSGAEVMMGDLITRYGGEQEAMGISWAEKAGYWQARAAELGGNLRRAATRYRRLALHFPMSWYALWARRRLSDLLLTGRVKNVPPLPSAQGLQAIEGPIEALTVVRRPALDVPVTMFRLGYLTQARRALRAMMKAGELPGSGRTLLAALTFRAGWPKQARRIVTRNAIPSLPLAPSDAEAFEPSFPSVYQAMAKKTCDEVEVPLPLAMGLVRVESRFNPRARSGAGATGLTQLMPKTARAVGQRLLGMRWVGRSVLRRPETNLRIGLRYLKELVTHFRGHLPLALAAYNAGIGAARSWRRRFPDVPSDVFVELIPYAQARNYVRRVTATAWTYARVFDGREEGPKINLRLPDVLGPYFKK